MIIARLLAAAAAAAGLVAWIVYLQAGLVLSHYDAKAHLVVARRVFDSLTPGWQQVGAVWLPLPHLIHLLPTQVDLFYRTGAFGSLFSVACFAVTAWAAARLVLAITGSAIGAATAAALLVLNPNLLYLQATPMTEPLLLAVTFVAVLWLYEWVTAATADPTRLPEAPPKLGWLIFAAAWTRYEAWAILGVAFPVTLYALWRGGVPPPAALRAIVRLARWPAAAVVLFVINSRITVGSWFVTGGFYVPDPAYQGQFGRTLVAIWWGTHRLSGYAIETIALATTAWLVVRALARRQDAALLIPVSLFAAAALPLYAFVEGHPFRIRYMVPVVAACALFGGIAAGFGGPAKAAQVPAKAGHYVRLLVAAVLIGSALVESPPWEEHAPMLEEAQWDVPNSLNRRDVTACLAPAYRGEKVMASMGSLAHYMQELSREGFDVADFVHEGTGAIWELAMATGPAPHAGWMLIEEQAEGGDILAQRLARDPEFGLGMMRICEGGGVALYRRVATNHGDTELRSRRE